MPAEKPVEKKRQIDLKRTAIGVLVASGIFFLGLNVGNGHIQFGPSATFHSSVSQGLPEDLDYGSVEQLYDTLRKSYDGQLSVESLLDGLKDGLAGAAGDQYTQYLDEEESADFDEDLNGSFTGIGARLLEVDDAVTVEVPLAGYPAERAGLKAKDIIIEIDGENALDLSVAEAVERIRGEAGTKVKLKVIRDASEQLDFEITREKITIPSVTSEILDGNIGYLQVSQFNKDTASLAQKAASSFKSAGVESVILDLRNNPGGLVNTAVDIASLWLPEGKTVLQEKRGDVVVETLKSSGTATLEGIPTVVLINEGSASASEIVAGALKDHDVATLIGTTTFGKGSVQSLENLIGGGILKVTIARWHTPSGKNIDKEGIEPDQNVERSDEDYVSGRDPQRAAAIEFLNE